MAPSLILAPMATLSHEAFRRCVERFGGCDLYFNEMINAGSLLRMGSFEKFYLMNGPAPQKMVFQLTGTRADYMANAASVVSQVENGGIDLNMGCSAPQIYKTGAGIAWMTRPQNEAQEMVHAVKSAIENSAKDGRKPARLSVKLRLGDEDFTDKKFFDFTDMLIAEGVQMLSLHARTKKEHLARRKPRYEYVEKLALRYPQIPVNLNGDIKDKESYKFALSQAPHASGVMIARAAAQKPWIFAQLSAPENSTSQPVDMLETALQFIDDVEECQPQEFWPTRLQRFFAYYCMNFTWAHMFASSMLNAKDNQDARHRLNEYFEKCPGDRFKSLF